MLVIIKGAPNTPEGMRGLRFARDLAADVCLIHNAVYFAQKDRLEGFCGRAYVIEEDTRLRGLAEDDLEKDVTKLDYDGLVEVMTEEDKVIGIF